MSTPKDHVKKAVEANLSPDLSHKPAGSPAQRSFAQSWLAIPRRQRLVLSCLLFSTALAGLYISDKLEKKIPGQGDSVKKTEPKS